MMVMSTSQLLSNFNGLFYAKRPFLPKFNVKNYIINYTHFYQRTNSITEEILDFLNLVFIGKILLKKNFGNFRNSLFDEIFGFSEPFSKIVSYKCTTEPQNFMKYREFGFFTNHVD